MLTFSSSACGCVRRLNKESGAPRHSPLVPPNDDVIEQDKFCLREKEKVIGPKLVFSLFSEWMK